jgi:hypothetical protein
MNLMMMSWETGQRVIVTGISAIANGLSSSTPELSVYLNEPECSQHINKTAGSTNGLCTERQVGRSAWNGSRQHC